MLPRVLEAEVMDTEADARDYDAMDHAAVNRAFVADFLAVRPAGTGLVLDVGTGTALIPIELCRLDSDVRVVALDAAESMLRVAVRNLTAAGCLDRVRPQLGNGRELSHAAGSFDAVVSNSLVHHVADPGPLLNEMLRVCRPGGTVFVRDLIRPDSEDVLAGLIREHAARATDRQRQLFADSLRAGLTVVEVTRLVAAFGHPPETVRQTSDRHWTWTATVPG